MKPKILIIDDEIELTKVLEEFFEKMNLSSKVANGGEAAIKLFNSGKLKVDLVVLDFKMGRMSGLDVLKAMREKGLELPVIVLTGSINMNFDGLIETVYQNVIEVLHKPVDLYKLLETIKKHFNLP